MANNITQLKIGTTTYDINDNRIITLTDNSTAAAGTWLAKTSQISAYADGQIFLYKITKAGASTTTLNITGSAGTALGAKTIYRSGTSKLTTHYGVGQYLLLAYNSTNDCFRVVNDYDADTNTDVIYSGIGVCTTSAGTAAKVATLPKFALVTNQIILLKVGIKNTATSGVTLNVNGTGAKPIYISGSKANASNMPEGDYLATYDGTNWNLTRIYLTDTTYSSKTAASGGTDVSLVTTGEKYTWNAAAQAANTKITPIANQGLIYKDTVEGNTTTREIRANLLTSSEDVDATTATSGIRLTSSDRLYPVSTDKSGYLAVYVPWTDDNTTYTFNGAVSTIKDSNLTASRALISNSSGKVAVSDVTSTELSYLDGVTSNIQTQLNGKAASSHGTHVSYGGNGSATTVSRSDHTHDNYITGLEVEEMIGSYDSSISGVYAPYTHTHNYAGSSSAGGAANSVKTSLTFNNGGSGAASGTTFNGSTARTISYNTVGAAPATHGHFYALGTYSEIGALKYDITAGNITSTSCWIAGVVSSLYCFGHVAKTGTNSYILFLWMGDVLHRSIYNGSSWIDDKRTYTQTNKLPSFSLSGTVLTITDNN